MCVCHIPMIFTEFAGVIRMRCAKDVRYVFVHFTWLFIRSVVSQLVYFDFHKQNARLLFAMFIIPESYDGRSHQTPYNHTYLPCVCVCVSECASIHNNISSNVRTIIQIHKHLMGTHLVQFNKNNRKREILEDVTLWHRRLGSWFHSLSDQLHPGQITHLPFVITECAE